MRVRVDRRRVVRLGGFFAAGMRREQEMLFRRRGVSFLAHGACRYTRVKAWVYEKAGFERIEVA